MLPWPLALLTLIYAALASASGAMAWKVASGSQQGQLVALLACLIFSAVTTYGLALMRPWARRLAVIGSIILACVTLCFAAWSLAANHPGLGVLITFMAGAHMVVIRYLRRPLVKAYFGGV